MKLEIRGAGFVNKGAELMLLSVLKQTQTRYKDIDHVISPDLKNRKYENFSKLGFYQKAWVYSKGIQWGYFASIFPARLRKMYGIVLDSEIDVVLDASGFAYSDQWGSKSTILTAQYVKRWKKQGTKIIFLPQAFGPFKSKSIRDAFRIIVDNADLIYARDRIYNQHITDLVGENPNVKLCPDFTNLTEGTVPDWFTRKDHHVCIIPNARMMDKTSASTAKSYMPFLEQCIDHIMKVGKKPFFLIHEGEKDYKIAQDINSHLQLEIPVLSEPDPLNIKGIIGASEAVISSRFHGLVSALSQSVPAIGTGWSHKYQMLFDDYQFPEGLLRIDISQSDLEEKIKLMFGDNERAKIIERLSGASSQQKMKVRNMWLEIFHTIENS